MIEVLAYQATETEQIQIVIIIIVITIKLLVRARIEELPEVAVRSQGNGLLILLAVRIIIHHLTKVARQVADTQCICRSTLWICKLKSFFLLKV